MGIGYILTAKCGHRVVRWCPWTTEAEWNEFCERIATSPCDACIEKAVRAKSKQDREERKERRE